MEEPLERAKGQVFRPSQVRLLRTELRLTVSLRQFCIIARFVSLCAQSTEDSQGRVELSRAKQQRQTSVAATTMHTNGLRDATRPQRSHLTQPRRCPPGEMVAFLHRLALYMGKPGENTRRTFSRTPAKCRLHDKSRHQDDCHVPNDRRSGVQAG